jgi:hypothetical protein
MDFNTKFYIEDNLYIKTKKAELSLLKMNAAQKLVYSAIKKQYAVGNGVRIIILKARQEGVSTLVGAEIFTETITDFNINSVIVAHDSESTSKLFDMYKLFYNQLSDDLRPSLKANNAKILEFDKEKGHGLKSSIRCLTSGTSTVGRGSTIHKLHASEFAFWPGDIFGTWSGLIQAVPNTPDSVIIIESTANGFNEFQQFWQNAQTGKNDFYPLFIPWTALDEYRIKDPTLEPTEEEETLIKKFGVDKEQLAWRRWCIKNNCMGDINKFKQEYPITADEAFISTGKCYFNISQINDRINELQDGEPIKQGCFTYEKFVNQYGDVWLEKINWLEDKNGLIKIYKEPIKDKRYAFGVDPSGEGSDNNICIGLDAATCEQVAELSKEKMSEDDLVEQIACLSKYYNDGLIAIETNFNAYLVQLLAKIADTKQFIRENPPDAKRTHKTDRYGFKTTSASRPVILSAFRVIFNEQPEVTMSVELLREMLTFVLNETGRRYEAMQGKHDDRVLAFAIALECRKQVLNTNIGVVRI